MAEDVLINALRKLGSGTSRNKTARLRDMFDEIEHLKRRGYTIAKIVETIGSEEFGDQALKFTIYTFKLTFARIKREREKHGTVVANLTAVSDGSRRTDGDIHLQTNAFHQDVKVDGSSVAATGSYSKNSGDSTDELIRPPGITNSEWSRMKVKAAAEQRKKSTINLGEL